MKLIKLYVLAIATSWMFASCGGSASDTETKRMSKEDFRIAAGAKDSAAVEEMVTAYMNFLKDGEYEKAISMIRFISKENPDSGLLTVSDEVHDQLLTSYKQLPIKNWSLREYWFDYPWDNTVVCDVVLENGLKTKMGLKPIRYFGDWFLSIRDVRSNN